MALTLFHPIVQAWFRSRFAAPTEAQAAGWPAIAQGRHTLIAAPTGSGKTLAAFLICIDRLVRRALDGGLPDATQVVYVSPLKALSNDIHKNLSVPLTEIRALAEAQGTLLPEIRVAVRTGDTPASERQRMAKLPPHILITTPESLYILLTSRSGRAALQSVTTLIVDEVHAIADDKRGAHLSLSVERLCSLADGPVTRIGLSATQKPIDETARLLVGSRNIAPDGAPECLIVDAGRARALDLAMEMPKQELGPIASHDLWAEVLDRIAELVRAHRTTLVFVNTRKLVERISHLLAERLGEQAVVAHHGSLSRATRLAAEQKLKAGEVQVCVATASLELGIDIGAVDLVCQVGSPRSINVLLQRIGRSNHTLGGTPRGRLFPLTRDELVECAALMRAVRTGKLDTLRIPPWPLDVLAQQIVAACSLEEWGEDALYELCTRAYPYRGLPRDKFDQVVGCLSDGFAERHGRASAYLHRDGVNRILRARRGAQLAAVTGGVIPESGDYSVIADPEGAFVGTVNEDFAVESNRGDVFLLGNTPWKIRRVESGRIRVESAQGQSPTVPFWLGEAPGRTNELSEEVTYLRAGVDARLDPEPSPFPFREEPVPSGAREGEGISSEPSPSPFPFREGGEGVRSNAEAWLVAECGLSQEAALQLVAYIAEGKRVLSLVPTGRSVVAERFFDESGGMQLVIHAPFGAAINRAWGFALRKQICRTFDFELQASATDDGLNFSLGPSMSFPLADVFTYVTSKNVREVLTQAVLQVPMFGTRWRWDATRALAITRFSGGRKVPPPLQRMRSNDLLAAVFPAQVACQDNAMPGDVELPDHPLVFETMRDCLTEGMDAEGLARVLAAMESGEIATWARETVQPSVFAHQLLNAMPYAFLDDAPLEERRARAVSLRRALPEDSRDLAALDPEAIAAEAQNAWPLIRDADELHDALLVLGLLPEDQSLWPVGGVRTEDAMGWFADLVLAHRAHRIHRADAGPAWVAAERFPTVIAAFPSARAEPEASSPFPLREGSEGVRSAPEDALLTIVRGWVECSGPLTAKELAERLGAAASNVAYCLARLENEGLVLRGRFRPHPSSFPEGEGGPQGVRSTPEDEFCNRRILARIHRATISELRRRVEPVSQAAFLRFLMRWQHVEPGSRLSGEGGLLDVLSQLQSFEAPAGAWESELLAARIDGYQPGLLDSLCLGGEAVWGRVSRGDSNAAPLGLRLALSRNTPITIALREAMDWLLPAASDDAALTGAARDVVDALRQRGASFLPDIIARTRRLPSEVEHALHQLAASGLVTSDSFDAVRKRLTNRSSGRRARRQPVSRAAPRQRSSRWSLLESSAPQEDRLQAITRQLLARYGVVFRELLGREQTAPSWREVAGLLRRMEARGEIYGGRFIAGTLGEQFATPEVVAALRQVRDTAPTGGLIVVSACDPLNLVGVITPGERVPAVVGNLVVLRDGAPLCSLESGKLTPRSTADPATMEQARALLQGRGTAAPRLALVG